MNKWKDFFSKYAFRLIDQTNCTHFNKEPFTALHSFAIDDALALSLSAGETDPVIRFWVHDKTVVLGIPDTRLPHLEEGAKFLQAQEQNIIVRNSGGLAVALDAGVLNISLLLPGVKELSIHDCYEAMVFLMKEVFSPYTDAIEAYEIVGSYCPGDYDLSIGGRKFAGISQRRIRDSASVQIYLDLCGNAVQKAHTIRNFYELSVQNEPLKTPPPQVDHTKMESLSILTKTHLTIDRVKTELTETLKRLAKNVTEDAELTSEEHIHFVKRYELMQKRNERIDDIT